MKPFTVFALLAVGTLAGSRAEAQIFGSRPPFTGAGRNPQYLYGVDPYGGLFGGPGTGLFGQGTYAPPQGPAPNAPGVTGRYSPLNQPVDIGSAGVTGHPTRFMSYSQYFLNQGGTSGANVPLTTGRPVTEAGIGGVLLGGEYARGQAGAPPQRPPRPASRR